MPKTRIFFPLLACLMVLLLPLPTLAQLGSRPADEWALTLESGRRMESLEIERVVAQMGLQPGEIVADIGAGTGIFSVPLARAVGTGGRIISVEVDAGFLPLIAQKAELGQVSNITPILGGFTDPRLPTAPDVAFFHDVLHHIQDREGYIRALSGYMRSGSRIVVVDYDMNVPGVPHSDDPTMLISPDQVAGWMAAAGFEVTRNIDMFPDKFFVIYTKR